MKFILIVATIVWMIYILLHPTKTASSVRQVEHVDPVQIVLPREDLGAFVTEYLREKDSPLADESEHLLKAKHWKLLIAISAIESQYCKRKIDWNCWGIGGDSAYRHYKNLRAAIDDADAFISHWQARGRWLTVEDMNCRYVQPCNPNWVRTVNKVLSELNEYERRTQPVSQ